VSGEAGPRKTVLEYGVGVCRRRRLARGGRGQTLPGRSTHEAESLRDQIGREEEKGKKKVKWGKRMGRDRRRPRKSLQRGNKKLTDETRQPGEVLWGGGWGTNEQ